MGSTPTTPTSQLASRCGDLRTGPPLHDIILDLATLKGTEIIVDVGCGNGASAVCSRAADNTWTRS